MNGIWFIAVLVLYFVPTLVIIRKGLRTGYANTAVIINLALGWTLVGWVVALAMAFAAKPKYMCPHCRRIIDQRATVCAYCRSVLVVQGRAA